MKRPSPSGECPSPGLAESPSPAPSPCASDRSDQRFPPELCIHQGLVWEPSWVPGFPGSVDAEDAGQARHIGSVLAALLKRGWQAVLRHAGPMRLTASGLGRPQH